MANQPVPSDRYALRQWEQDSARQKAKKILGLMLATLFRLRAAVLLEDNFTHHGRHVSLLDRLIGAGLAYRMLRARRFGELGYLHKRFWGGAKAKAYHDAAPDRFDSVFVRYHMPLIDKLETLLRAHREFKTLCEIGSGAGLVADYLAKRFDTITRYIAVDLDPATVAAARATYRHPKLEFVTGDATAYLNEHGASNWVLFTQNGVLEYFDPEAIDGFFTAVAALKPVTLALIEPVARDHDLETQFESWPFGQEFSFSHNYPYLLAQHGLRIIFREEVTVCGYRYLLMLATSKMT